MSRREQLSVGELTLTSSIKDFTGAVVFAMGYAAAPTGAGYAPGCLYVDESNGTAYTNGGSVTSATFNAITPASSGGVIVADLALAQGSVIIGDSGGLGSAHAVTGDVTITTSGVTAIGAKKVLAAMTAITEGKILIGAAGGAGAEQTLSGDATVSDAGVVSLALPKVKAIVSQSLVFSGFTDGGSTSGYIDIATQIPAGSIVIGWKAVPSIGFTGDTTATIQVGVSGTVDKYSVVTTGSVAGTTQVGSSVKAGNVFEPAAVTARVTVTGTADFTSISAGTMVVTLYIIQTA